MRATRTSVANVKRAWSGFRRHPSNSPIAAGALVLFALVAAYGPAYFLVMLLRSALWPWCLLFLAFALWNLVLRRGWMVGAAMIAALICLSGVGHSPAMGRAEGSGAGFRVALINVLQENRQQAEVAQVALDTDADAIAFLEVDPLWARALDQHLGAAYPYRRTVAGTNQYGIALYSRLPFNDAEIFDLVGRPAIEAHLMTPIGEVRLFCAHTSSPRGPAAFRERNRQLEALADRARTDGPPVVIMGDLNAVSWDVDLERMVERLEVGEAPTGPPATWPTLFGKALMPLDHIFVSSGLGLEGPKPLRIPGSDHRGLVADIGPAVGSTMLALDRGADGGNQNGGGAYEPMQTVPRVLPAESHR